VVITRGEIYWADLGPRKGSAPAKLRPVVIVQSDPYNRSRLATVVAVVVTSNTSMADLPGNVFVPAAASGLPKDSVINVTGIVTLDRSVLGTRAGKLPKRLLAQVDTGLRAVLALPHH
jgi:mRNA interferase MazF